MKVYRINSKVKNKYAIVKVTNSNFIVTRYNNGQTDEVRPNSIGNKELLFMILLQYHNDITMQKDISDYNINGKAVLSSVSKYFERAIKYYLKEDDDFVYEENNNQIKLYDVQLIKDDGSDELEVVANKQNNTKTVKNQKREEATIKTLSQQFNEEYYNSMFNRTSLLEKIDSKLAEKKIAGLVSGPGYGKTSLAAKYANDKDYEEVYFIECDTISSFKKSLKLDITDDNIEEIGDNAAYQIMNVVDKENKYLLIFDNISYDDKRLAEENTNSTKVEAMIAYVIDTLYEGFMDRYDIDIIYTSRADRELVDGCNIAVSEFSEEEAREYLTDKIDFEYTDNEITKIINSTQLPIVLNAIKNYAKNKKSYKEFDSLCSNSKSITLKEVMEIIFKSFTSAEDQKCKKILRICSILYNTISIDLLLQITKQFGIDASAVKQVIRKLSENLNILVYKGKDHLYLHRSYQEVILANCMSDNDIEVKKELYDAVVEVFKTKINRYLTFSIDTAKQIEENILHINKILVDQAYKSDDFYYLILSCIYSYGTNYSRENEYYNRFIQYLSDQDIEDVCITYIKEIYESQITLTNKEWLSYLEDDEDLDEEEKQIILPKAYYALGSIYRELNASKSDYDNSIEYYKKCYEYSEKQRQSTKKTDKKYVYYTQYMLMSYFRMSQIYSKRLEYKESLEKLHLCNEEVERLKKDVAIRKRIVKDLEYIEAKLKNAFAVYYMENSSPLKELQTGLQYELELYEIYDKYNLLHEKKNIIFNLSLYYVKLAEKYKPNQKEYYIYTYMSIYYVELYRILRDKLGTVRYDNSGNYFNQKFLTVFKTFVFNKNISISKEEIMERLESHGDKLKEDIMLYSDENMIDNILSEYPLNPDYYSLFEECASLLTNAFKQYSNQDITLEQYATLNDNEKTVTQYIATVVRYYGALNKKMYQVTKDDKYYNDAVKFLKLSIALNKRLDNNGQQSICLRELYVLYDMSAKNQGCFIEECYKKKAYYKRECRLNELVNLLSDQSTKDVFAKLSDSVTRKKEYKTKCEGLGIDLDF